MRSNDSDDLLARLERQQAKVQRRTFILVVIPAIVALLLLGYTVYWFRRTRNLPGQPANVRLTFQAWSAFNTQDYGLSIARANACITQYESFAAAEQQQLRARGLSPPPVGAVPDAVRAEILNRGPLNDVATCWFIKARALEALGETESARRAYTEATRYIHARAWDPRGWFWSPSEAARERLAALGKTDKGSAK